MSVNGTVVGYDPGGNNAHGLAIANYKNGKIINLEVSTHATANSVVSTLSAQENIIGIGIDTLSCWSTGWSGWRPADRWLRERYSHIQQSIASANSLYGSMGLNGMAVLINLRQLNPDLPVTETHPKVLYNELSKLKYDYKESNKEMDNLANSLLDYRIGTANDHEWDALISVHSMARGLSGNWKLDLHALDSEEGETIIAPCGSTNYWWPKVAGEA